MEIEELFKANQYGFDESEEEGDIEEEGGMQEWQKALALHSPRVAQENNELAMFRRVKHRDDFEVLGSSTKKKDLKLVDVLGDLAK